MQHRFPDDALSAAAFHRMFLLCGLCLVLVAVMYLFTVDRYRQ
jgi:hypothetical protein